MCFDAEEKKIRNTGIQARFTSEEIRTLGAKVIEMQSKKKPPTTHSVFVCFPKRGPAVVVALGLGGRHVADKGGEGVPSGVRR